MNGTVRYILAAAKLYREGLRQCSSPCIGVWGVCVCLVGLGVELLRAVIADNGN